MTEGTAASADQDLLKIAEGLRKALDGGPHVLHGTEKAGVKPLFSKPPGKALAQRALAEGYVEPVASATSKKPKAGALPAQVRLTEKGRQFILDTDSPKVTVQPVGSSLGAARPRR